MLSLPGASFAFEAMTTAVMTSAATTTTMVIFVFFEGLLLGAGYCCVWGRCRPSLP